MTKTVKKSVAFLSAAVMFMAMLLYFPGGTFSNIDWGLKASAATITPTEPSTDDGGVYQIGTAEELYWFAACVNGGNTSASAVLTADITVNEGVLNSDGTLNNENSGNFTSWTPIGNLSYNYTGTFDGQGFTVSGLYFNGTSTSYVGLFGYCYNGTIKNVGVEDSYFNGKRNVGGVCGCNYAKNGTATITNCYNSGAVNGTGSYVGGVCGYNYAKNGTATITNSYNSGAVNGTEK